MKLLLTANDSPAPISGVNTWQERLVPLLVERGVEVHVVIVEASLSHKGRLEQLLEEKQIPFSRKWALSSTESKIELIAKTAAEFKPDLYVASYFVAAYQAGGILRELDIPTLGMLHSDDEFHWALVKEFSGHEIEGWICVSDYIEEEVGRMMPGCRLEKIYYGVPCTDRRNKPQNYFNVGYSGRLDERQKRISLVFDVLAEFIARSQDSRGYLYGGGEEAETLKAKLAILDVRDRLTMKGSVSPTEMLQAFEQLHAFVLLSNFEGLPIALLEAMANGVVPICSRMKSGIAQVVTNGENGFVVDSGEEAVQRLLELSLDPDLLAKMSNQAAETIKMGYSVEASVVCWVDLIKAVKPMDRNYRARPLQPVRPVFAAEDIRRSYRLLKSIIDHIIVSARSRLRNS